MHPSKDGKDFLTAFVLVTGGMFLIGSYWMGALLVGGLVAWIYVSVGD